MNASRERTNLANAGFRLQERDRSLLVDLYLQRAMSRDQIVSLGYFSSVPRCNNRLRKLLDGGFVKRHSFSERGSGSQAVYGPDKASCSLVAKSLELPLAEVARPVRDEVAPLFLAHTLGLVDLRIRFEREARHRGLRDFEWLPELLCRHEYSTRSAGTGWKRHVLKPDAYASWVADGRRVCTFLELDLGHVGLGAFSRKVESYRRYLGEGVFQDTYGEEGFEVVVVTTGERRLTHLQSAAGSGRPRFLFTTSALLDGNGPFAPIWRGANGARDPIGGIQ